MARLKRCLSVVGINLLVLLGIFFLFGLLVEGGRRTYCYFDGHCPLTNLDFPTYEPIEFDPEIGWVLRKNFSNSLLTTNTYGFRSTIDFRSLKSVKRQTLLLGDSFVFGSGVKTSAIFSETLNRRSKNTQFINLAVPGYSTGQEYLALRRHLAHFQANNVVLFYVQSNDQWTNTRKSGFYPAFELDSREHLVIPTVTATKPFKFLNELPSYDWIFRRKLGGRDLLFLFDHLCFLIKHEKAYTWRVTREILALINQTVRASGASFTVVNVPSYGVSWSGGSQAREALLEKAALEMGFSYWNLRDIFPADPTERSHYFLPDDHWNEAGHLRVADFLEKALRQRPIDSEPLVYLVKRP